MSCRVQADRGPAGRLFDRPAARASAGRPTPASVIAAAVVLYFFVVGIGDGSVSSFNMDLWMTTLAGVAAVLGGGWWLNANGRRGLANAVLLILAIPGLLFGLFLLAAIVLQPRWN